MFATAVIARFIRLIKLRNNVDLKTNNEKIKLVDMNSFQCCQNLYTSILQFCLNVQLMSFVCNGNEYCTKFTFVSPGKMWGDPCGQPVLCVHGIQDNAGTFDCLIPLLPSSFHYVSVDLPGHGFSSHFPEGIPLDFTDHVLVLIRILNHLQWESCYYIGHSLGGQLGVYLSSLWPQRVKKLVMLDAIAPMFTETPRYLERNKNLLDSVLISEEQFANKKGPNYTYEEALDRIMNNRNSKLTKKEAKIMLKRSLVKNGDGGFRFTTDQRLKRGVWSMLNPKQQDLILHNVTCPVLAVLSALPKLDRWVVVTRTLKLFEGKQNYQRVDVEGDHDVHLNNPEKVAPHITKFLTTQKCSL